MDLSFILKVIPEAEVAGFVDSLVDSEVAKLATELNALVKTALDKTYGTNVATATPVAPAVKS